jgi:hypothetical protein
VKPSPSIENDYQLRYSSPRREKLSKLGGLFKVEKMNNRVIQRPINLAHPTVRKIRYFAILVSLLAAGLFTLVSVAAAADLHSSGYDENCNLCQFSKSPTIISCTQFLFHPEISLVWDLTYSTAVCYFAYTFPAGGCRAPPANPTFSS